MSEQTIVCPNCGKRIPVSKALTVQIEADLRKTFEAEAEKREEETQATFEKRLATETVRLGKQARKEAEQAASVELSKMQKALAEAQKREKIAQASFERRLAEEKSRLERQARKAVEAEVSEEMAELQEKLQEKDKQVAEVRKQQSEIQKRQKQLTAREKSIEAEITRRTEKMQRKTREEVEEEYRSHELELEKKLSDAKRQAAELKRKLDQSSQQAQGEVIEIELEHDLTVAFPDDKIEAIARGKLGADIIQKVMSPNGQQCGTIVWESKNTKNWSRAWIAKLKSDQRKEKAEIAVLVSATLPRNFKPHFGQMSGVWVSDFSVAPSLATALRLNLIDVARIKMVDRNKPQNMEILYRYLMSTEFRQRVEAIVEAFVAMRNDLHNEKQVAERNWAKREKHLELVLQNVSGMVGDIQAITPAFPNIKHLALPEPD